MLNHKRITCTAAILVSLSGLAVATEPLVAPADLQAAGMRSFWQATLPLQAGDEIDTAYLVDEVLYVVSNGGNLFAITADVGLLRWVVELVAEDYAIHPPTHAVSTDGTGHVVVQTTPGTFLLDRFNGQLIRRFSPPFAVTGPAIMIGNVFLSGSADSLFYAMLINPRGSERPFKLWEVRTDGPITSAPLLYDGDKLLFATQGGTVYSCSAADKEFRWAFPTGGAILADPAIDESGVYIASLDRSLYKLNRVTGKPIWRVRFPAELDTTPAIASQTVYQYCWRDGLSALDFETGKVRWRIESGLLLAAHSPAGDMIFTRDRNLLVVDHTKGRIVNETPVSGALGAVSNTKNDAVFLLGTGGRVQCLRLDDVPYLRRQRAIAARRRLNLPPLKPGDLEALPVERGQRAVDPLGDDPLRSPRDRKKP